MQNVRIVPCNVSQQHKQTNETFRQTRCTSNRNRHFDRYDKIFFFELKIQSLNIALNVTDSSKNKSEKKKHFPVVTGKRKKEKRKKRYVKAKRKEVNPKHSTVFITVIDVCRHI